MSSTILGTNSPESDAAIAELYPYYPVSTRKFVVLSICTLGLYEVYWAYKMWQRIQMRTHEKMSPGWRACFLILYNFSLFKEVQRDSIQRHVPASWNPNVLGLLLIFFSATARLPGGFWFISIGSFLAFLPVLRTVNAINATTQAAEGVNNEFSGANFIVILIGGLMLLLAIVGTFMLKIPIP